MARLILLLGFTFHAFLTSMNQLVSGNPDAYVKEACEVTRYQSLCINSLAPFSTMARRSPSRWARAGVSVTIGEVKNLRSYLINLQRHGSMRGRNRVALSDCVETFGDALDELHRSLGVLRSLSRISFGTQMGDLNTWISAAMNDEDTCMDGFEGKNGREIRMLQNRVLKSSHITSNALALVNKLAETGL